MFVFKNVIICYSTKSHDMSFSLAQSYLCPLMNILKEHVGHMEKDQLNSHQSELTSFFLSALDFRTKHCQVTFLLSINLKPSLMIKKMLVVLVWKLM